jgi:quercetin dioxygenase-like cupin family protein
MMRVLSRSIMGVLFVTFVLVFATKAAMAQDPVKVAPEHYKALLDNDRVRVLEVTVKPGEKTAKHSHPANVIYSFNDAKTKFTVGGKSVVRELKADTALWGAAETHTGENVGTTETRVLVFELKGNKGAKAAKGADPMKADPAHFKVLLNNSRVRLLEFRAKPGEKILMHSHPDYVTYSFTNNKSTFSFPDGKTAEREAKEGTATFNAAETHAATVVEGENHGLLLELKPPRAKPKM